MNSIKNIVFDMGGVLVDLDREAAIKAFNAIGFTQARELLDPYLQRGLFMEFEHGKIDSNSFRAQIRSMIDNGDSVEDSRIDDALNRFISGMKQSKLTLLENLHKRFKVYMLSNTNPIAIEFVDRTMFCAHGHSMAHYFDRVFTSYQMKLMKPGDEIFLEMLRQGEFEATQTLFIDDSEANIETARRLGFNVLHLKATDDLHDKLKDYLNL